MRVRIQWHLVQGDSLKLSLRSSSNIARTGKIRRKQFALKLAAGTGYPTSLCDSVEAGVCREDRERDKPIRFPLILLNGGIHPLLDESECALQIRVDISGKLVKPNDDVKVDFLVFLFARWAAVQADGVAKFLCRADHSFGKVSGKQMYNKLRMPVVGLKKLLPYFRKCC